MKLMADNYEDDHFRPSHSNQTNHKPSPDQVRLLSNVYLEKCVHIYFDVFRANVANSGGLVRRKVNSYFSFWKLLQCFL
jgi:hypothetical protein